MSHISEFKSLCKELESSILVSVRDLAIAHCDGDLISTVNEDKVHVKEKEQQEEE